MVGAFQVNAWIAAAAALGVIFSAAYALTLYRKVALGNIENPKLDEHRRSRRARVGDSSCR